MSIFNNILGSFEAQLNIALTAYPALNVPDISPDFLRVIKGQCTAGLVMSVCVGHAISLCLLSYHDMWFDFLKIHFLMT
jgi:hypothetical protein